MSILNNININLNSLFDYISDSNFKYKLFCQNFIRKN